MELSSKLNKEILHRIHMITDAAIGALALGVIIFGEEVFHDLFLQADMVFHIIIVVLAFGAIVAERVLHRHRHKGVIAE